MGWNPVRRGGGGARGEVSSPGLQVPWPLEPVKPQKTLAAQNVLDKPSGDLW